MFIYRLLNNIPTAISYFILLAFCLSGTLVSDLIISNFSIFFNANEEYTKTRTLTLVLCFISLFLLWAVSSCIAYLFANVFNGKPNGSIFFKNTSSSLIIGIIAFFIDMIIIYKNKIIIHMSSNIQPVFNETLYIIRQLNYSMYFVLSILYVIIIHYSMKLSWERSSLSIIIPFCLIFWTGEYVTYLLK